MDAPPKSSCPLPGRQSPTTTRTSRIPPPAAEALDAFYIFAAGLIIGNQLKLIPLSPKGAICSTEVAPVRPPAVQPTPRRERAQAAPAPKPCDIWDDKLWGEYQFLPHCFARMVARHCGEKRKAMALAHPASSTEGLSQGEEATVSSLPHQPASGHPLELPLKRPIIGFLLIGLILGPAGVNVIQHVDVSHRIADFGIIFFLFETGLELSVKKVISMRADVFGLGMAQFFITGGLIAFLSSFLLPQLNPGALVLLGGGMALSSSAFALQLLRDKKQLGTRFGRASLGVLLFQDLAVVPLLVLAPLLSDPAASTSLSAALAEAFGKAMMALGIIVGTGHFLLRPLLTFVKRSDSSEAFLAMTLGTVLLSSSLTQAFGLSETLGAFVGGVLVAETDYKHQIEEIVATRRYLKFENHPLNYYVVQVEAAIKDPSAGDANDLLEHLEKELEAEEEALARAFKLFDNQKQNKLGKDDLKNMHRYLGFPAEDADINKLMVMIDTDKSNTISFDEFQEYVGKMGGSQKLFEERQKRIKAKLGYDLSAAESTELASAQLDLAGIDKEAQAYWKMVVHPSEFAEAAKLVSCQCRAVKHIRMLAKRNHQEALPKLQQRITRLGFKEDDLWLTLAWIRELAPVIVHVNLDKMLPFMEKDTHYRNQFETQTSGGLLKPATREKWERDLFGGCY
ncbi:unnamed protein product, partial [Effrenium voratum]